MIVSIIIPAFNRVGPLRDTLQSAHAALAALSHPGEIIIVDDGSNPPLASLDLPKPISPEHEQHIVFQENAGSIVARQTGLRVARGRYVQFLDSDDLLAPEKLRLQIDAMKRTDATLSIGSLVDATPSHSGQILFADAPAHAARRISPVQWLLNEQPAPHVPLFRREAILDLVLHPMIPPARRVDAAGDIWLYQNCALMAGTAVEVPAARAAIGVHDELRFSLQWEKLAYTSLLLMEWFMAATRERQDAEVARRWLGIAAFRSWRRLPIDFDAAYQRRLLAIFHAAPKAALSDLDGTRFGQLARWLGPVLAARVLRRLRNHRYATCRSVDDATLQRIAAACQP